MNTSSTTATQSLASQTRYALSLQASSGPARPEGTEEVPEARRLRHDDHEHRRGRHHRTSRSDDAAGSGAAFTTLKLKIEQTFSALTGAGSGDDDSSTTVSGFEGEFQAKIQFSGSEGEFKAKLKFSLDSDSATGAADFASALQGFAQTLFAAQNALYGGDTAPATPTLPDAGGSTAPITPPALSDTPTPTVPAVTDPVVTPPPADAAPIVPGPPSATPQPLPSRASTSISIKLRATYDSFENNLGPLVNQLAQPNLTDAFPALTSLLGDLADRFGQLVSQTPAAGANAPSLNDFLKALSGSLFGTLPPSSVEAPTADLSTAALSEAPAAASTAAATTDPAATATTLADPAVTDPVVTDTPSPAPSAVTAQRYTATLQYQQVLAYSDAGSSVSLRTSLSARMVYEVA